jgi:ABC-type nitrate/sulfonate/bicarbonate transport system substrate-binding protein
MNKNAQTAGSLRLAGDKLRVGFVPLTDCAPLVMAQELGLFKKYGLRVELSRELGWATIRDKIIHRELDAAHALGTMPVAAALGLGSVACDCVTGLVLNLNGNAITLADDLWQRGVRDGKTLRAEITRSRQEKMFTFGVVFPVSSHRHLLRRWFSMHGIDPERDVRIVVLPPPQMVANLKAGHLDGFCAGEPWNSLAVQSRAGWIAAASSELDALHPEKVLMVRGDFALKHQAEHLALIAALLEACEYCDQPENHTAIAAALARPEFVGVSETVLRHGIGGAMDFGHGLERVVRDFCVFHRHGANEPSGDKAAWVLDVVRSSGLCRNLPAINFAFAKRIFRPDIFQAASALRESTEFKPERESEPVLA